MIGVYLIQRLAERRWANFNRALEIKTAALFVVAALSLIFLINKYIRAYLTITQKMLLWTLSTVRVAQVLGEKLPGDSYCRLRHCNALDILLSWNEETFSFLVFRQCIHL